MLNAGTWFQPPSTFTCLVFTETQCHMWHVWHSVPCSDFMIKIASSPRWMKPKTHSETEKLWSLAVATLDMQSWQCYSSSKASSKRALKAREKVFLNSLPFGQDLGDTMHKFLSSNVYRSFSFVSLCTYLDAALEQWFHLRISWIGRPSIKQKEGESGR